VIEAKESRTFPELKMLALTLVDIFGEGYIVSMRSDIVKSCANCGHCDSGVVHWCLIKKEIEFEGLRSCIFDNHKYWMYDGSGER
jgi:hypothetical protein